MKNVRLSLSNLSYLFQCTRHPQRLCTTIDCALQIEQLENLSLSILSLKSIWILNI
jgi:hypothetical protein